MQHYLFTLLIVLLSVTNAMGQEPVKVDTEGWWPKSNSRVCSPGS